MTLPRPSTVIYWLLALFFAWGLALAVEGALKENYPTEWRFSVWWVALLGTHLARVPLPPILWFAFLFDAFNGYMMFMYAAQAPGIFLLFPLLILAAILFVWRRGHYNRMTPSKGDPHV